MLRMLTQNRVLMRAALCHVCARDAPRVDVVVMPPAREMQQEICAAGVAGAARDEAIDSDAVMMSITCGYADVERWLVVVDCC